MFEPLRQIFRSKPSRKGPSVPDGTRYYVVGDIHGRLDLLEVLAKAIEKDIERGGECQSTIVLLGDLVDRGPDSAGVVSFARKWKKQRDVRILAGNHEEMFLQSFEDKDVLRHFLKYGGRETIISYGLKRKRYREMSLDELFDYLPGLVSKKEREFIANFEESIEAGDYLFVHAGVNPKRPLDDQRRKDMLWIRERFLNHTGDFGRVIVHGHTIRDTIQDCGNRIGIDTGAYRTGRLTALVLEGNTRRSLAAVERKKGIVVEKEEVNA